MSRYAPSDARRKVAVEALDDIDAGDPEGDHIEADNILLAIAPPEVARAYERLRARSGGWWYA